LLGCPDWSEPSRTVFFHYIAGPEPGSGLATRRLLRDGLDAPRALEKKRRLAETAMDRLAEAVRQGVKVALGTDSSVGPHGRNLRELGYMVELGMPALEAIRAGTLHAAQLLRWTSRSARSSRERSPTWWCATATRSPTSASSASRTML
jgi:Amidohydrolase family